MKWAVLAYRIGGKLYSFGHSRTIESFKRTGSITMLQKAMGHSSLNLSYLRGHAYALEI